MRSLERWAMSAEALNLRCATCASTDPPLARSAVVWAELEAYGGAEWLDAGVSLPTTDAWPRSSIMPLTGRHRHIRVSHPFAAATGGSFWVTFVPGSAALNGWAADPETIDESALVLCRMVEIARRAESWAWILVAVGDVVPLPELERRIPPRLSLMPQAERHRTVVQTSFRDWELIEGSSEGDVGAWFLARRSPHKVRLIAAGQWSFHEDTVWAGNLELVEGQWERLCAGMVLC